MYNWKKNGISLGTKNEIEIFVTEPERKKITVWSPVSESTNPNRNYFFLDENYVNKYYYCAVNKIGL